MRRSSGATQSSANSAAPHRPQTTNGATPNRSADNPMAAGGAMRMKLAGSNRAGHRP